jgi:hypothetical protein
VTLSAELQARYGYDAQKASEYQAEQAAGAAKLGREMQVQQEQSWAAERARAEENYKARLESDRQAEAARVQAQKEQAAQIKMEIERYRAANTTSVGSGRARSGRR